MAHPCERCVPRGLLRGPLMGEAQQLLLPKPGMKLECSLYALASDVLNLDLADS